MMAYVAGWVGNCGADGCVDMQMSWARLGRDRMESRQQHAGSDMAMRAHLEAESSASERTDAVAFAVVRFTTEMSTRRETDAALAVTLTASTGTRASSANDAAIAPSLLGVISDTSPATMSASFLYAVFERLAAHSLAPGWS